MSGLTEVQAAIAAMDAAQAEYYGEADRPEHVKKAFLREYESSEANASQFAIAYCRTIAAQAPPEPDQGGAVAWLDDARLAKLLAASLKPEEIGGDAKVQHERVRELLFWFARFADGNANPKWATAHAMELAYYIATNAGNRHIDTHAISHAAFLEGVNVTPHVRDMLTRLGKVSPAPTTGATP